MKKSGKWPEPRSGSFRRIASPGRSVSTGCAASALRTGERHRAHVARRVRPLRDHAALGIEDGHREVLALARLLGVRGLVHGGADLDRDGLQRPPHHAERDRIDARAHWMATALGRSQVDDQVGDSSVHRGYRAPGGSTEVDSRSSTMAGPASCMPAASL